MNTFLLLILSLMAATDAGDCGTVKGCLNMWLEFSCNYMSRQRSIAAFKVAKSAAGVTVFTFKSIKKNIWEQQERLSLYHDKRNKTVRVVIKKLEQKDIGKYKFSFYRLKESSEEQDAQEVEVKFELLACQPPFSQTAYRTVGTTITCDYPGNTFKNNDIYVCKEKGSVCEESSRTFIKRQTNASLSVSISDVSLRDQGVYWCAIKRGKYRAAFKRVELQVKAPPTTSQPTVTTLSSSAVCDGGFWSTVTAAVACVALLLFVLNLVFIYKHFCHVKNTQKGEVRNNKEEAAYEEIEVHPPKAGSGTELKTIYITAGFPPHASAESHDHSDANSVTCSTAKEKDQQPTYSTVGHPRAPPEDASNGSTPLYYTVNKH